MLVGTDFLSNFLLKNIKKATQANDKAKNINIAGLKSLINFVISGLSKKLVNPITFLIAPSKVLTNDTKPLIIIHPSHLIPERKIFDSIK